MSEDPGFVAPAEHRIPHLDGYRAAAALGVVLFHVTTRSGPESIGALALDLGAWRDRLGNFAVCLFFLLSGLVLYRPFVANHLGGRAAPSAPAYLRRRALRIFPAYIVALTAFYLLGLIGTAGPSNTIEYLWQFALVQNYTSGGFAASLPVAWTLCIEVAFYLALPLFAWVLRRLVSPGSTARSMLRLHLLGVGALYASGWAYRCFVLWVRPEWSGNPVNWMPAYLDWFALGMLLAVLHAWRAHGGVLPRWIEAVAGAPGLCVLFALQLYWILVQVNVPLTFFDSPARTLARFGLSGLAALLLLVPAVLGRGNSPGLAAMEAPVSRFLGSISYGIYLWHLIVIRLMERADLGLTLLPRLLLVTVATVGLATVSYRLIELPIMSWRRRVPARGSAPAGPVLITR